MEILNLKSIILNLNKKTNQVVGFLFNSIFLPKRLK